MNRQKEQHLVKIKEHVDNVAAILFADAKKLLDSGGIDVDSYPIDGHQLAKVIVTASMHRQKDVCRIYRNDWREDIENLIKM